MRTGTRLGRHRSNLIEHIDHCLPRSGFDVLGLLQHGHPGFGLGGLCVQNAVQERGGAADVHAALGIGTSHGDLRVFTFSMQHGQGIRDAHQFGVPIQIPIQAAVCFGFVNVPGHEEIGCIMVPFGFDQSAVEIRQFRIYFA